MTDCNLSRHENHSHSHGPQCGHTRVIHAGHVDYLHDGHMHHVHGEHIDEHSMDVTSANPERCTPEHQCQGHQPEHEHGPSCGHESVPHGDHIDYLVDGHLHYPHDGHCDDHGPLPLPEPFV